MQPTQFVIELPVESDNRSSRNCDSKNSKSVVYDEECLKLVLALIVSMVHALHNSGRPDQVSRNLVGLLTATSNANTAG